jgi:hypothetical protein
MIFDVPFGDGINSLLITGSGAFFFGNPLARELFVRVQLLNDNVSFVAVFNTVGLSILNEMLLARCLLSSAFEKLE